MVRVIEAKIIQKRSEEKQQLREVRVIEGSSYQG